MFQPGVIVREGLPHLLAAVKALDDLRNVQAGLHVGVQKGLAGVIEAAGVFLLQQVHHLFHHPLWGEDLVGFLGWDVVEDILGAALVKVIRQLDLQVQKLLHRIVKHHWVEQVACKMLLLSGGLVDVRPTVPQKAELFQRDAGDLLKDLVRDDLVKVCQRHGLVTVGHEEGRDGAGKAPEMVTDGVLVALFLLLLLVGLHGTHDGLLHFLRRLLDGGLQGLHQCGGALLLLCVKLPVHLLALLGGGAALQLLGALDLQLALVDTVVVHHLVHRHVHFGFGGALKPLLVGQLQVPAILLLCLLHHRSDDFLGDALFQGFQMFFFGRSRGICQVLQGGVQRGGAFVDLYPEHIRCLADDVALVQIHLALVVQGEVCAGLRGDLDGLCLCLADGLEVLQNVQHLLRRTEHVGNILEQEVALEAHPHHFLGLDLPGNAEDFFRIQRDHLPFLVLTDDREEVEQILDVCLALLGVALAAGGVL